MFLEAEGQGSGWIQYWYKKTQKDENLDSIEEADRKYCHLFKYKKVKSNWILS
jgi:hypothetical protein